MQFIQFILRPISVIDLGMKLCNPLNATFVRCSLDKCVVRHFFRYYRPVDSLDVVYNINRRG